MKDLLTLSGTRIAGMIRNGEISSVEAVTAHIERIKKVNPVINAVVKDRFEQALEEAAEADELLRAGSREPGPFHGVPCTIKECFMLKGMPNSSGLVARKDIISDQDATAVQRIKKAGAIPLGVTNTPELCMWFETYNRIYGRTNNPYNPERIVGGSSGGEGAIIAAGGSPFGIGSDVGGSIRMPAFFNGVFGHKPTGGMVPGTGQYPMTENEALRYLTTGPLARRAEDLFPLLKVIAGPDGKDRGCKEFTLGDPSDVKFSDLNVVDIKDNGGKKVSTDLVQAQEKAAERLESAGAKIRTVKVEALKKSFDIWSTMLTAAGGESFASMMGAGKNFHPLREIIKMAFGLSDHTLPATVLAMIEPIAKLLPGRTRKLMDAAKTLRQELEGLIGENGIMLYPSHPLPAPPHNRPLLTPFNFAYTAILNIMEFPVTQVPLGLNDSGLPLGIQVAALHGKDHVTIAVALELEKAFGGWKPPDTERLL